MQYLELKESRPKGWLMLSFLMVVVVAALVAYLVLTARYKVTVDGLLYQVEQAQEEATEYVIKAQEAQGRVDSITQVLDVKQLRIDSLNENIYTANEKFYKSVDSVFYLGADSTWRLFTERTDGNR